MVKSLVKYGLLSCGILLLANFGTLIFGKPKPETYSLSEIIGYVIIIVSLSVMFFGIKSYREKELGGKISFGMAFVYGTYINFLASLTFAFYNWLYVKFIYPDFMTDFMKYSKDQILNSGMSQAEIANSLAKMDAMTNQYSNIWFQSFVMFSTVFLIGIIIALLSALILKKNR